MSLQKRQMALSRERSKSVNPSGVSDSLWPLSTVARQAPLSMGFPGQEYRNGLTFPSPRDLPDLGIEPRFLVLEADSLPSKLPDKPGGSVSCPK